MAENVEFYKKKKSALYKPYNVTDISMIVQSTSRSSASSQATSFVSILFPQTMCGNRMDTKRL